ncbi:MAG: A/G-specific adenine glycosylase [Acidobacteriaceae bacterium]
MPRTAKPIPLKGLTFSRALGAWYAANARALPWRGAQDPYHIWVSEIMLQQTRVAAVIDHYHSFLKRFPTLVSLALAAEEEVLAVWSGLGYYRRARTLHEAAKFVVKRYGGKLPRTAPELRALPGVGDYTAAAVASIAFGETVPVLDGNVERVLLRLLGQPEKAGNAARAMLLRQAADLMPSRTSKIAPGDHNQAMMELGATICLPAAPLCKQCPVKKFCATRGEHATQERSKMRSQEVAYLLDTRKQGAATEVRLRKRPADAALMPRMWELPEIELSAVDNQPALLRLRHSITSTNYYVRIHAALESGSSRQMSAAQQLLTADEILIDEDEGAWEEQSGAADEESDSSGNAAAPEQDSAGVEGAEDEVWFDVRRLGLLPLTGLARKVLQRLDLMSLPSLAAAVAMPKDPVEPKNREPEIRDPKRRGPKKRVPKSGAKPTQRASDPRFQRVW